MNKFFIFSFLLLLLIGCMSGHVEYIKNNPDFLKPGLYARAFLEAWGQPDENISFQSYLDKQYSWSYHGGYYNPYTGFYSPGYGSGRTYTPTTVVWIYKKQKKVLFFQQRGLGPSGSRDIQVWKLIGWRDLPEEYE